MPTKETITEQQVSNIAAVIRWRGSTLAQAHELWSAMLPADRAWWTAETRNILAHAGLVVAPKAGA